MGFEYRIKKEIYGKKSQGNQHKVDILDLRLMSLNTGIGYENLILFLACIVDAAFMGQCYDCSLDSFVRLDFSPLSEKFTRKEISEIKKEYDV